MLEMWGAMGIAPGPFQWWQYERLFLGWKRQHYTLAGHLWAAILAAGGATIDKKPPTAGDFTSLADRPGVRPAASELADGWPVFKKMFGGG